MPFRPRRAVWRSLMVVVLALAWMGPARPAGALLSSDPMAIISAVNYLRAANGLPPYVVDPQLMDFALEHSRYQASLHTATHEHSDGSTVWQHGMDENIATGMLGMLTPEYAVYTIWADAIHMKTMIGYASGSVGAGVADDGADEYYTLNVRPSGSLLPAPGTAGTADPNATPTKITPLVPLLTVTPRIDRWIIHTVGYGQSLWGVAIAYGVKMDQIRAWNSMEADTTSIYTGQKLYIIAPAEIWPTLTASPVGMVDAGQTPTPGWSITEEPAAATEKAAYQAAAGLPKGTALVNLAPTQTPTATRTATSHPTASPDGGQETAATTDAPPDEEARPDELPLIAGLLILFGGGLLLVIGFTMLRRPR